MLPETPLLVGSVRAVLRPIASLLDLATEAGDAMILATAGSLSRLHTMGRRDPAADRLPAPLGAPPSRRDAVVIHL